MLGTQCMYLRWGMGRNWLPHWWVSKLIVRFHITWQKDNITLLLEFIIIIVHLICVDIDECDRQTDLCEYSETCENTAGSYNCDCPDTDDNLALDGRRCISKFNWAWTCDNRFNFPALSFYNQVASLNLELHLLVVKSLSGGTILLTSLTMEYSTSTKSNA